jgi:hypothetical protein
MAYTQYLRSNDMLDCNPPDELLVEATNASPSTDNMVTDITNNISTITQEINNLTKKRNDYISLLQRSITTNLQILNFFTPAHKIPAEILGEIFLLCIPNTSELSLNNWHNTLQIFLNVCPKWRAVAMNNPYLWTYLYLLIDDQYESFQKALHIALNWFKYMGPQIKLDITIHFPHPATTDSRIRALYKILQPQHQIRGLQLITVDVDFRKHLSELYLAAPPLLNRLTLTPLTDTYHIPIRPDNRVFFSNALQPKHLTMKGQNIYFLHPTTFKEVTFLSLESNTFYTDHFYQVLKECINIKELHLIIRSPILFNTPTLSTINMEHLQSLFVKTHKLLPRILASISAPNLTKIDILKEENFMSSNIRCIIPFLSNLKRLSFISIDGYRILKEKAYFEDALSKFNYPTPPHIIWNEQDNNLIFETNLANYISTAYTTDSQFALDSDEDTVIDGDTDSDEDVDSINHNQGASGPEEIETDHSEE